MAGDCSCLLKADSRTEKLRFSAEGRSLIRLRIIDCPFVFPCIRRENTVPQLQNKPERQKKTARAIRTAAAYNCIDLRSLASALWCRSLTAP